MEQFSWMQDEKAQRGRSAWYAMLVSHIVGKSVNQSVDFAGDAAHKVLQKPDGPDYVILS